MKSQALGASISAIEVTHINARGFWLFIDGREYYLPYSDFPWFADATVRQICHIERNLRDQFHWPDLDVDLTLDMIESPEKYPLKYK
ncbi:DUF2442 domain-containing protein [bacterium]|nr:DUF2442 domain-containing protein [bacterium]